MTMILNYVVQCSCWSVGQKKSSLMWEGSIHCFLENAVRFNHWIKKFSFFITFVILFLF